MPKSPEPQSQESQSLLVDCDSCPVRGQECGDCVVSFLLSERGPWLDAAERRALNVLADSGLVPPLRLVSGS